MYICQCYSLTSSQLTLPPPRVLKSILYVCVFIPVLPLGSHAFGIIFAWPKVTRIFFYLFLKFYTFRFYISIWSIFVCGRRCGLKFFFFLFCKCITNCSSIICYKNSFLSELLLHLHQEFVVHICVGVCCTLYSVPLCTDFNYLLGKYLLGLFERKIEPNCRITEFHCGGDSYRRWIFILGLSFLLSNIWEKEANNNSNNLENQLTQETSNALLVSGVASV